MSVNLNISSLAMEYSIQRERDSRSIGLNFQRRVRVIDARLEAAFLLLVADRKPVLDQDDPGTDEHPLEFEGPNVGIHDNRPPRKNPSPLDAGDCTNCGQTKPSRLPQASGPRNAENTTASFPFQSARQARLRGQRGIERLCDALDRSTLSGGVAALEDDHHLLAPDFDPFVHLHQLDLQPAQLLLICFLIDFLSSPAPARLSFPPFFPLAALLEWFLSPLLDLIHAYLALTGLFPSDLLFFLS